MSPSRRVKVRLPAGSAACGNGRCTASDLLREVDLPGRISPRTDSLSFPVLTLAAGTTLSRQGERLAALFFVLGGALKLEESGVLGETQVKAFYLAGDALGLDAFADSTCHGTITALEPSTVAALPLETLIESTRELREMECFFHRLVGREIAMRSRALGIVAPPVAEVGLARFLLELGARQDSRKENSHLVRLSMSRRDIASHLGIAHETVSRALTSLAEIGCIETGPRAVRIRDLNALQRQAARQPGRGEAACLAGRAEDERPSRRRAESERLGRDRKATTRPAALGRSLDGALDPSAWLRTPILYPAGDLPGSAVLPGSAPTGNADRVA